MIELKLLRSSMSSTFHMCSVKYLLSYILGYNEPPNQKTVLGTIAHKVLEILAKIKLAQQNGKSSVEDEATGKFYLKTYTLDKIIDKVYDYYTKAFSEHQWTEEEYKKVKKWVAKTIEYNNGQYDPRNQNIVSPESNFDFQLDDPDLTGLRLCGTIDLVVKEPDGTLHIIDYKTGKRVNWGTGKTKEYSDLLDDFQLNFYHLASRMIYSNTQDIKITIFYINDGGPYELLFKLTDISRAIEKVKELYTEITTKIPQIKKGFYCRFCSFSKTTFEEDNKPVIINTGSQGCSFTNVGDPCTKCDTINYMLKHRDVDAVIKHMSKDGHDAGYYSPPGAI